MDGNNAPAFHKQPYDSRVQLAHVTQLKQAVTQRVFSEGARTVFPMRSGPVSKIANCDVKDARFLELIIICNELEVPWFFDIAVCDFKASNSARSSWNMKSGGNRFLFRLIVLLKRKVRTA
jgi:hypothetical protein